MNTENNLEPIKKEEIAEQTFVLDENIGKKMDEVEQKLAENYDLLVFPLVHRFTNGLYSREIELPKGTLVTSRTHLIQHQFFLMKGKVSVWDNEGQEQHIEAPFVGFTEPNTRRIVYAWEDTVWVTCHPNPNNEVLEDLENEIFEFYENPLIGEELKKKIDEAQKKSNELSVTINKVNSLENGDSNEPKKLESEKN